MTLRRRPRTPARRAIALVVSVLAVLLLAACDDGRIIEQKHASEPNPDGTRLYRLEVSDGPTARGGAFEHVAHPDDDWVRHCFEPAEVGDRLPFYCTAGRTPTEEALATTSAFVAVFATWFLSALVGLRVPSRAPAGPVPPDASLFSRAEAEKRAHAPVWREHSRMILTGYAGRCAIGGFAGALILSFIGAAIGPARLHQWLLFTGFIHLAVFGALYGWWAFRRGLIDETRNARLSLAIGIALGLLLAGILIGVGGAGEMTSGGA